jgi:hypothetical protein
MISTGSIMAIDKSEIQEASKALAKDDLPQLVEWLSLKDDNIRYQAFLLLQSRSMFLMTFIPFGTPSAISSKVIIHIREASGSCLLRRMLNGMRKTEWKIPSMNTWHS